MTVGDLISILSSCDRYHRVDVVLTTHQEFDDSGFVDEPAAELIVRGPGGDQSILASWEEY